jgi:hypothetical protein
MTVTPIDIVVTGLDPVIHPSSKELSYEDGWMPGSSPGMTSGFVVRFNFSDSQDASVVEP